MEDYKEKDVDIDESLQEYIDEKSLENCDYTATLYRYTGQGSRKECIHQFENEIPNKHNVGMRFGSGRYQFIVNFRNASKEDKMKSFSFVMGKNYDEERYLIQTQRQYQVQNNNNNNSSNDTTTMLMQAMQTQNQMLFQMVMKLIESSNKTPDITGMFQNMMSGVSEIMTQQMMDTYAIQRKISLGQDPAKITFEDDEEEDKSFMEQIFDLMKEYLPVILGKQGKIKQKVATSTVKGLDEFKEIVNDPEKLKEFIRVSDERNGVEVTNEILKQFNVKRI